MFKLPEEVKKDIENYRHSLKEAREGKLSFARFKGVRVPWGIYSHRGGEAYMTRIRIPAGLVSPLQLRALSRASEKFGGGLLHITTRQDIQIHNVKIEDTIKVLDYLKDYGLSPRGGGGNTVRNVIACPLSGVCKEELFNVREYAVALTEYLLRQDTSFTLPRKFKISFSGCGKDCAGCLVNDLGFLAAEHGKERGFKAFVGGGMGANSRVGKLLEEFIPAEGLVYCVTAVKNIFYRKGDRRNKHHNRLRFLIEDIGAGEFKRLYKNELQELRQKERIVLRAVKPARRSAKKGMAPKVEDKEYKAFLKYSVSRQKQRGFANVELRIPRGDILAEKLTYLADLEKEFEGIEFHTSQNQNLYISWIRNEDLRKLFLKLKDILDDFLYPSTLLDVVACKGALTCNLGLCNSPGLAEELERLVREDFMGKKVFGKLDIRLNGCPNACGHHPVGKLSFHGVVRRADNRPVPFYKFLIGGRKEAEFTRLAEGLDIIPAKNIPGFLRDFLAQIEEKINKDTDINKLLGGAAKDISRKLLKEYSCAPSYSENRDFYIDWGKKEDFSLEGLGPGECGAGILDMIEADLTDAGLALEKSEKQDYSYEDIKRALLLSARALLVVKGLDPKDSREAFEGFKEKFIIGGIASGDYGNIEDVFNEIKEGLDTERRKSKFSYAKSFLEHINELYKKMDASFNFPKKEPVVKTKEKEEKTTNSINLKGTPCPINYVKTKLVLENLNSGDLLEVLLDEGEPMNNVPRSLKDDGHEIIKIEKIDGFYKIVVKKR